FQPTVFSRISVDDGTSSSRSVNHGRDSSRTCYCRSCNHRRIGINSYCRATCGVYTIVQSPIPKLLEGDYIGLVGKQPCSPVLLKEIVVFSRYTGPPQERILCLPGVE